MGTSVTHRSPRTLSWGSVQVGYENVRVPEARVLRDVWRAALLEPQVNWSALLGTGIVARCLDVAVASSNPTDGLARASAAIAESGESSLATDVAKRAVVASFTADDRAQEFTARVFAAATDYLVSRDLPATLGSAIDLVPCVRPRPSRSVSRPRRRRQRGKRREASQPRGIGWRPWLVWPERWLSSDQRRRFAQRHCIGMRPVPRARRQPCSGEAEVAATIGELTTLESDLLRVVAAVFAADLATKRGEREGFVRDFDLTIPVVNHHAFQRLARALSNLLYVVSDDNWRLTFTPAPGQPEGHTSWPEAEDGCTLLFSGGLDSLAAAIDLLEAGTPVGLASHYTANPVIRGSQNHLLAYLEATFGTGCAPRLSARITGRDTVAAPFPGNDAREPSQRTRSVMFLALAALSARRSGRRRLLMIAENGQMAIHLPLTAARIGAFSTHTAHPEFVRNAQEFLSSVLGVPFIVENPFLYRTKAECVSRTAVGHRAAIPLSVSCWKSSRQAYSHCGECVPCFVRRIALAANGVVFRTSMNGTCSRKTSEDFPQATLGRSIFSSWGSSFFGSWTTMTRD